MTGSNTRTWLVTLGAASVMASLAAPARAETQPEPAPEVTLAAVGDIACSPDERAYNGGEGTVSGCRQKAVSDVVRSMNPAAFLALGDIQHHNGTYDEFMAVYDKQFGDLKPITRPIPGNHEYNTTGAAGYYRYFGNAAHQQNTGHYSFRAGSWHVLAINSAACTTTRPCGPGSTLSKWIAAEVAANPAKCMAVMWHHPVWSAGSYGNNASMVPVWNQLHSYGADLVMHGHDHGYQRSKPLGTAAVTSTGTVADPTVTPDGMVQFIVGTGGQNNFRIAGTNPAVTSAMAVTASNPSTGIFGALRLRLGDGQYAYDFVPAAGTTFTDSGSAACRQKTPPTDVPAKPAVTVARSGDGAVTVNWTAQRWADRLPVTYTAKIVGRSRQCVSTQTSCVISGLTNGETYSVVVTASNDIADVPSEPVTFIPAVRPVRPASAAATVLGDRVTVTWPATTYTGGLPVTYRVTSSTGARSCTTSSTSCTIGMPAGSYRFNVVASNEAGSSAAVTTASVQVLPTPIPTITGLARAGDGRIAVTVTPGSQAAQWQGAEYVITSTPGRRTCTTTTTSCVVSGLVNGTSYTFTAVMRTPVSSSAVSAPSASLVAGRVSVRPAAPTVNVTGPGSVTVSWAPPSSSGGLPVTGYEVMVGNGPRVVCATASTTCDVTGLAPGSYWFTVVAINDAGKSANSSGSAAVRVS